jgi:hypothetical protein
VKTSTGKTATVEPAAKATAMEAPSTAAPMETPSTAATTTTTVCGSPCYGPERHESNGNY